MSHRRAQCTQGADSRDWRTSVIGTKPAAGLAVLRAAAAVGGVARAVGRAVHRPAAPAPAVRHHLRAVCVVAGTPRLRHRRVVPLHRHDRRDPAAGLAAGNRRWPGGAGGAGGAGASGPGGDGRQRPAADWPAGAGDGGGGHTGGARTA
uniref:PE-PGRS family protein n=1 Tax=Parastrongyloides trichosuri TaxID=131310 RepID=A0A0N5A5U1_PARTI